jgi:2-octaprenyl-6-methoxyphenol hydroxylase
MNHIIVAGGGPVGLAFALAALALRDTRVTVIEREPVTAQDLPAAFDHRVYALSPAAQSFLASLDVWSGIPAQRIAPVQAMQVHGDDGGELEFAQILPLAHIVEFGALMQSLARRVRQADDRITLIRGAVAGIASGTGGQVVTLEDGTVLEGELLVGADGSRSRVRASSGIAVSEKDYQSDGVVANFAVKRSHGDIARQWFSEGSVLAWLPLPDEQISIVWSVARERATGLMALEPGAFCEAVTAAGHGELGKLTLTSPVARFPLQRVLARHWVQPGLALIGDAAHAIHPLAGQGVNLGFADAQCLADRLARRGSLSAIGDLAVLRSYERRRRENVLAMAELTDKLRSLYLTAAPAVKWARNRGMSTVNRLPLLKAALMAHAMN